MNLPNPTMSFTMEDEEADVQNLIRENYGDAEYDPDILVEEESDMVPVALDRPDATRWLWTCMEKPNSYSAQIPCGYLDVNTRCVKHGIIPRCAITPMAVSADWMMAEQIPDGLRLSEEQPNRYKILPGNEIKKLVSFDPNVPSDKRLIEIRALFESGLPDAEIKALRLNRLIFPNWPMLPQLILPIDGRDEESVFGHLTARYNAINQGAVTLTNDQSRHKKLILQVIDEMLNGCQRTYDFARDELRFTNDQLANPKPGNKDRYDTRDYLFMKRTGIAARHEAQERLAQDRKLIVQMPENNGSEQLVQAVASSNQMMQTVLEQNAALMEQNAALMRQLQAKQLPPSPAEVEAPKPTRATRGNNAGS